MTTLPSYQELRTAGKVPRVHPNGFIQLDLGDGSRLHCWPADPTPRPQVLAEIHDHVYSFESEILCGELTNLIYQVDEDVDGQFKMMQVAPYLTHGRTTPLAQSGESRYHASIKMVETHIVGRRYRFKAREFHRSVGRELTATLMRTESYDRTLHARVLCPIDVVPDLFLREAVPAEQLWSHIEQVCKVL